MRALRGSVVAVIVLVVSALTPAAAGGGWWNYINLDPSHIAIGDTFTFRQQVMFADSVAAQDARHEDYGAYLMREINQRMLDRAMSKPDPEHWWEPVGDMVRVGDVEFTSSDTNLAWATVRMSIPELPTGSYYLMLCDTSCRNPLADIVPSRVLVSGDILAVQTARRLERLENQLNIARVWSLSDRERRSRERVLTLEEEIAQMDAEISVLQSRLANAWDKPETAPWIPYATGAAVGVLLALLLTIAVVARHRLVRATRPAKPLLAVDIPDDPRELAEAKEPSTIS